MSYLEIIKYICNLSPEIFFIIIIFTLSDNYILVFLFFIGFYLNSTLNKYLKKYIYNKNNEIILLTQTNDSNKHIDNMPSGHMQRITFCLLFYLLANKKNYEKNIIVIFIYLILYIYFTYHCFHYNYHSFIDIILGVIYGLLFGYFYFTLITYNKFIKI